MINNTEIHILWKKILSYAFSYIWVDFIFVKNPGLLVFFENRTIGVYSPCFQFWIFFFQKLPGSANSSSGSYSHNKMIYFSAGLFPDFWTGSFVMRLRIR